MIQEYSSKFFPTGLGIRQPRPATHRAALTGGQVRIIYQIVLEGCYAILATFAKLAWTHLCWTRGGVMFRSWWQQIRQHPFIVAGIIVVSVLLIALVVVEVRANGTGFTGKTLWDWLQLLAALAIPVVVGFGVAWYTANQGKVSERDNKDSQREAALQEYITRMSELLLEKNLRGSEQNEEVRKIARVRTLTILGRLDGDRMRKRSVLLFLKEADLVGSYSETEGTLEPIIDLWDAGLSQADLSRAHLNGVRLSKANLSEADLRCTFLNNAKFHWAVLRGANLSYDNCSEDYRDEKPNLRDADFSKAYLNDAKLIKVDLSRADLSKAILKGADLSGANLKDAKNITIAELEKQAKSLKGAIMPDGKMYPKSSKADLSGVDLREADLSGVDLSEANLNRAEVTEEQLAKAKSLKGATMPDGSIHR
jgi:uncharacterized protein YjbI with pentapeptide repeats